ncbi:hypothetical protein ACHAW6_003905 [Cyclotella cf. meneghiniana]
MTSRPTSWHVTMVSLTLLVITALTIQSSQSKYPVENLDFPSSTSNVVNRNMRSGHPQKFRKTTMVGGFSSVDSNSEDISSVTSFALAEFAFLSQNQDAFASNAASFVVLPSQVQSGEVAPVVLEAQRQVVAGMNYKLTIGIVQNNKCLGGFKVTVWKQLSGELKVTNWGATLGCDEINARFGEAIGEFLNVETNALRVQQEVQVEKGEVEPDE